MPDGTKDKSSCVLDLNGVCIPQGDFSHGGGMEGGEGGEVRTEKKHFP